MPITSFPPAPSRSDPVTFPDLADAYLAHLESPFVAEANALEANVNAKEASTNALALAAVNAINISAWVSGTTYAVGVTVYDQVDLLSYRRSVAGAGITRPGLDNANWVVLNGLGNVRLDTNQTFTGDNTFTQPINSSGANLTNLNAGNLSSGTVPTARLGSGTASASTVLLGNSTYGRYYDPVAIAGGEVGAPKIADAALETTVTVAGTEWVQNRIAASTLGAVGTYAFLQVTTIVYVAPGVTVAGSSLRYAGRPSSVSSPVPTGTWQCRGYVESSSYNPGGGEPTQYSYGATLWLRIA